MRVIGLVDCDSFYVSCERIDNPSLKNKAVCVLTGAGSRSIIVSRSKEAKELGIPMGAPLFQVERKFKNVIYIPARKHRYTEISRFVMDTLRSFTPDIEVVSIDEAYMDLTNLNTVYHKTYGELITHIRNTVLEKTGIPVSIGLSTSKTLAKLASDKAKKQGGIFAVSPKRIQELIGEIDVDAICGIGKQSTKKLKRNGIFNINDFIASSDSFIRQILGKNGLILKHELNGATISLVNSKEEPPQSIQDTSTLPDFTTDKNMLIYYLKKHIKQATQKLREWNGFCQSVHILIRTKDFKTFHEWKKCTFPTNSERTVLKIAIELFETTYQQNILYRSIGIELSDLTYEKPAQADLFEKHNFETDTLDLTIDTLEKRFGNNIISKGFNVIKR